MVKSVTAYHGSGRLFNRFEQKLARIPNDFMGGGIAYFTDNLDVAKTYAKSRARSDKTGTPYIYTVQLNFNRLFDVDDIFTGKNLIDLLPADNRMLDAFARGSGLMKFGSDTSKVIVGLRDGKFELNGYQVFKGLSHGGIDTAVARDWLISRGYDGLRYNGGENMDMAVKHNAFIPYDADSIKILKITKIVIKKV